MADWITSKVMQRRQQPTGRERARRAAYIAELLHQGDMEGLRRVAIETGFLSRSIRGSVWPMLLNVTERPPPPPSDTDHREKRQVELDVHRSLTHVGLAEGEREERLGELGCLIDSVLAAHPDLHYYQGFNDVCSTLVVVMGDAPTAYPLAERLATHHLREAMTPNMHNVQQALKFIMGILRRIDPQLFEALRASGMEPVFAVSWVITWFAHDIGSLGSIERIYDFFLASHPLMNLYLSASLLRLYRRPLIQARGDYADMHAAVQHLPTDLPLEDLIWASHRAFKQHPPAVVVQMAALSTERAFKVGESMWIQYPYPFLSQPGPSSGLIEWRPRRRWRRPRWGAALKVVEAGGGAVAAAMLYVEQAVVRTVLGVLVRMSGIVGRTRHKP